MDAICIKDLKKDLKREMDDSRYEHTLGVMYTSAALAMRYEYDMERAMLAGLMHDCAKCIPNAKKLKLAEKNGLEITELERNNPFMLHAKVGAMLAKVKYDIDDEDIENLLIQQIEFCNTIIFNKVDTISEEQLNKVKTIVKTLQPNAKTIDTNYGKVPVSEILNTERFDFDEASMSAGWIQALENYDADEDEHHDHDEHEHEEHEHEEHGHHHDEHEHEGHEHEGHDHHHDEHENDDHGHHGHHHHHHHHHGEGEAEEYGIGSFVYYRRKPFAKEKFEDWINDMPKGIIRSKGIIWAAENNNDAYMFEQAGKQINITNAGRWYATAPRRVRAQAMKDDPTLVKDWDEEVGDRMIKLVFIGQNLDKEAIIKSLDDCLA